MRSVCIRTPRQSEVSWTLELPFLLPTSFNFSHHHLHLNKPPSCRKVMLFRMTR